jgi:hypothetical protein
MGTRLKTVDLIITIRDNFSFQKYLYIDLYMALLDRKLPFGYRRGKGVMISYVMIDTMTICLLLIFSAGFLECVTSTMKAYYHAPIYF